MDDNDKIYTPEILADAPFPGETSGFPSGSSGAQESSDVHSPATAPSKTFPVVRPAVELMGAAFNTRQKKILGAFEFTPSGAIQIGKYENGVSGDIKLSPIGIVARDQTGQVTFILDGDRGDAFFRGTIQTGTLISGVVAVGNSDIVIDGEAKRMVFFDDAGIPAIIIGNP